MTRITSQRGISLLVLIIMITVFAGVALGFVRLLRTRHESYPYQVQSYQAYTLAHAGAEFAIRYARDNAASSGTGSFAPALADLIASTNGRFNLGDGAFELRYVAGSACSDTLYSRGCSTRFNADGTCPGATREVRLQPFGSAVVLGLVRLPITSAISKIDYPVGGEPNIGYAGSRIQFRFCDYTIAHNPAGNTPYGAVDGQYGPAWSSSGYYFATIAATRDGAGNRVTIGRVGFTGMNGGPLWIWDAACGPCTGSGGTYPGRELPAWDKTSHPIPLASEYFQIVPVRHGSTAHSRWPTSGYTTVRDRPQTGVSCDNNPTTCCAASPAQQSLYPSAPPCGGSSPPYPCCEPNYPDDTIVCIDKALAVEYSSSYDRTDITCSGEVVTGAGSGLTSVKVQLTQGGQFTLETFGKITPPVTFYFQFPYSPCDVPECNLGPGCRTKSPPQYITWVFTVN
jgi:hypothetical protein